MSGSPDIAQFHGHLYSDKPPMLSILGSGVYWPLERLGYGFVESRESLQVVNVVLVFCLVALPSGLALYAIRRMLQAVDLPCWFSDVLTISAGVGSLLLVYGVTFNNHSPAAGLMAAAFGLVFLSTKARPITSSNACLAGGLASSAAVCDLPAGGLLWVALFVWVASRSARGFTWFLVGSVPMAIGHSVAQSLVTGSPLPVEFYPSALEFEGSYWASVEGTFRDRENRIWFLVELLVGPQGWITMTPVLWFFPLGVLFAIVKSPGPLRQGAIVITFVTIGLLLFYAFGVRRTDFAGLSYGTRHLLAITPLCYVYAIVALQTLRPRAWRLLFLIATAVGILYASCGVIDPWSRAERRASREIVLSLLQRVVIYSHTSYDR